MNEITRKVTQRFIEKPELLDELMKSLLFDPTLDWETDEVTDQPMIGNGTFSKEEQNQILKEFYNNPEKLDEIISKYTA